MMGRLTSKNAIVTGASSGIGLAAARLFLAEGAKLAITANDADRLRDAQTELSESVLAKRADAASISETVAAISEFGTAMGKIDVLFLNAGVARFAGLAEVTEEFFDDQFDINVKGVLFAAQAAVPLMRDGGSIVVTTSVNAAMGMGGTLVYAATKAAAGSIVRVLAGELAGSNIRVNAVSPGPVETPIYGKLGLPQESVQAIAANLQTKIPLGRFGQADEIARVALFLASDDASFITGQQIVADGGWTGVMP
jgi:NAD(P)-dependent dehydrogenase (short-subunit alcohol dehydrogenase family)